MVAHALRSNNPLRKAGALFASSCWLVLLSPAMPAADRGPRITRLDGSTIPTQQVDAMVNHLLDAAHVTGAGVAIFQDGRIVYLKAYGLRDTDKHLPLTPDSVMTSASLSKADFATVVMRLMQQGNPEPR